MRTGVPKPGPAAEPVIRGRVPVSAGSVPETAGPVPDSGSEIRPRNPESDTEPRVFGTDAPCLAPHTAAVSGTRHPLSPPVPPIPPIVSVLTIFALQHSVRLIIIEWEKMIFRRVMRPRGYPLEASKSTISAIFGDPRRSAYTTCCGTCVKWIPRCAQY